MHAITRPRIPLLAAGLGAALTLTLAGCGGDSTSTDQNTPAAAASSSAAVDTAHNDADVIFAEMMILHHREAVTMSELADGRASSAEVKKLASQIKGAQQPEIDTMTGWLQQWGASVPTADDDMNMGGMEGMDHGMPGDMSDKQMAGLEKASGAAFDRSFLTMMIDHHKGAISMAKAEQLDGSSPAATALAGKIISAQQGEITTMKELLAGL
jgi:uncharacterized protein (DUF305 family)